MYKLNLWTLRFPEAIEIKIQEKLLKQVFPIYMTAFRILLGFFSLIGIVDQLIIRNELSIFRLPIELLIIFVMGGLVLANDRMKRFFEGLRSGDIFISTLVLIFYAFFLYFFSLSPPNNVVIPYGISIFVVILSSLLPFDVYFKAFTGAIFWAGFSYISYKYGFFPETETLDLTRQMAVCYMIYLVIAYILQYFFRAQAGLALELDEEREKVDQLLLNVLPASIAKRLKSGEENIVDRAENVTIIFADLVGFTKLAAESKPSKVVRILNDVFSRFDLSAEMHGVEKIKTMGDNYFAVSGIPDACDDHAARIARLALEFRSALEKYSILMKIDLKLRIGINTGPVVAGVIGTKKFLYDLWGDTVNLASRMESTGEACKIQITQATKDALGDGFLFSEPQKVEIKGKGMVETYFLLGEK